MPQDSRLSIAGRTITETDEGYFPRLLLVFTEDDRHASSPETDDDWGLYYEATAEVVRDRLDVLGYGPGRARRAFSDGLETFRQDLSEAERAHVDSQDLSEAERARADSDIALLIEADEAWARESTFDGWQNTVAWYLNTYPDDLAEPPSAPVALAYLLQMLPPEEQQDGHVFGFPGHDVLACLRGIVDVCPTHTVVRYDLSGLVHQGYMEEDATPADAAWSKAGVAGATRDAGSRDPVIILTEGSFDSTVLRRSLALLSPHLTRFFSFLDFDEMRVPGGAGTVVGFLKAFVAAGVANRIVAIFDNDAAGHDATRALASLRLPSRVRVLHYPDLALLETYPTIGPTGAADVDVNGLAGSLELYLGADVLTEPSGTRPPVHWRGYMEGVGAYQGELLRKQEVQQRFLAKLAACETDPTSISTSDWSGIRHILDVLRTAFTDT